MPEDQNLGATVDAVAAEEVATSPKRGPGGKFVSAASDATVTPGNCGGELVELPDEPGTTYHSYECQVCHQVLHVGLEDLAENGLPVEHAPLPVLA